ncbi:MAG: lytic transglycosylase domain-containing protein [Clostridia bacterium]|nr:lytic transglycosylase domain-containing protein [Clostridia bacterium]
MNTPSPAPQRRRRMPQDTPAETDAFVSSESPAQSVPERQAKPAKKRPAPRRRTRAGRTRAAIDRAFEDSIFERIPSPVRVLLIVICLAVFISSAAGITRSYLARQEERRRLEAEAAERAQHPLEYAGLITQYALAQDLDPALVSAVILCESSFNPQAESRLGARGLMQLMEDTAGWVAHKLDEDDASYSFDRLYDAETNIRFGTWYLGYLSRRFDGDATKIVCAYHAGQGNVDAWLKNPEYSRDGVTLDVIPTQDTATYASRVLRARDVYRKYYFPQPTPEPAF